MRNSGWALVSVLLASVGCGGAVTSPEVVDASSDDTADLDSSIADSSIDDSATDDTTVADSAFDEGIDTSFPDTAVDDSSIDSTAADTTEAAVDSGTLDTGTDTAAIDSGKDTGTDTGGDTGMDTGADAGFPILSDVLAPSAASCTVSACGRWTFGSAPTYSGALTAFPSFTFRSYPTYPADGGPLKWWAGTSTSTLPMVMYNTGADTPYHPTKKVSVHPGNAGENVIVEWLAPTSADYKITGAFVGKDSGSRIVRVFVVGGSKLLEQTLAGTATVAISIPSVAITAGQKIRFAVDPNGSASNDTTMIDAQLEWAAPSPCTSSPDGTACGSNMHCCGGSCVANASTLTCGATSCAACTTPSHAYPTCSGAACGFACSQGYGDCNMMASDGCERAITNDVNNCGGCNTKCATPAASMHQVASCTGTACGAACAGGYGDCNTMAADGCERAITNDVNNCGACNKVCPTPAASMHQTASCTGTTCGGTCVSGYGDCNMVAGDGCERAITNDPNNCGACNKVCPSPAASLNQVATCTGTTCGATCKPTYLDCDGSAANGCECAPPAPSMHQIPMCSGAACTYVCEPNWGDCNGLPGDGCEQDLSSDNFNCGTCFHNCGWPYPNCVGGICSP